MTRLGPMTPADARSRLDEFLRRRFGNEVSLPQLGPILVDESATRELDNAFAFSINTARYFETGDRAHGLMTGAVIVPKDRSPVHWAPTAVPVEEYLHKVRTGESWWSGTGAHPKTSVRYRGKVDPADPNRKIGGLLRSRTIGSETIDESFTRDLTWKRTDFLRRYELGHNDLDLVELTAKDAAEFVRRARAKRAHSPES
jgi:hypothetical protein